MLKHVYCFCLSINLLFVCFCMQVDVISFKEFLTWMDERLVSHDQPFMARIYQEDVAPCLNFPNKEVRTNSPNHSRTNVWVMYWELIVQSAFIWASYQMPSSPYCMIYLWWETERENHGRSLLGVKGLNCLVFWCIVLQKPDVYSFCLFVCFAASVSSSQCDWKQHPHDGSHRRQSCVQVD